MLNQNSNPAGAYGQGQIGGAAGGATQYQQGANGPACLGGVGREMTVVEILDRRIEKAERLVRVLQDLKGNLPGNYLNSGASRISAILEL